MAAESEYHNRFPPSHLDLLCQSWLFLPNKRESPYCPLPPVVSEVKFFRRTWVINKDLNSTDLSCSVIDNFFRGHIAFVAHQQLVDTLASVSIDFLKPLFDICEGFLQRKTNDKVIALSKEYIVSV